MTGAEALAERARNLLRAADRPGLRRVRAPARGGERDGLRRPPRPHGADLPRARRGARALPGALRPCARGRVPGHQPSPRTSSSCCSAQATATSASSVTPTRASTGSGGPRCATSWSSSGPSPMPAPSSSTRTTAPPRPILDAANAVIANNVLRQEKTLWSALGEGEPIRRYRAGDERDEATLRHERDRHASLAAKPSATATSPCSTARTRRAAPIETALADRGIAYKVIGGTRFFDRREIRDVLAYLRARRQPRRRGVAAPHLEHAAPRHRRHDRWPADRLRRRWRGRVRRRAASAPRRPALPARPSSGSGGCSPCSTRSAPAISSPARRTS